MTERVDSFLTVLELLQTTQGTNAKKEILMENILTPHLKEFLVYTIDDRIKFNVEKITKVVEPNPLNRMGLSTWDNFVALACVLETRALSGDKAIGAIQSFLSACTDLERKWYTKCIQKDLACITGLGRKVMNDVWPDSVLYFKCGLAEEEKKIDKAIYPSALELKKNGIRTFFFLDDAGELFVPQYGAIDAPCGRSGLPIENFTVLNKFVKQLEQEGYVLDGECSVEDCLEDVQSVFNFDFSKTPDDFRLKSGKIGKGWEKHRARMDEVLVLQRKMKFTIFDIVPIDEWEKKEGTKTYTERRVLLEKLKRKIRELGIQDHVEVIDSLIVNSYTEAMEVVARWIAAGYEGGVLKCIKSTYQWRRWINWIKIKEEVDFDFQVVSVYLGKTKFNGDGTEKPEMAGGINVVDQEGREFQIGTGVGWDEAFYEKLWKEREAYVRKIGKGTAQKLTKKAAICPRFDCWRTDKVSLED